MQLLQRLQAQQVLDGVWLLLLLLLWGACGGDLPQLPLLHVLLKLVRVRCGLGLWPVLLPVCCSPPGDRQWRQVRVLLLLLLRRQRRQWLLVLASAVLQRTHLLQELSELWLLLLHVRALCRLLAVLLLRVVRHASVR
jgi:hypothetical protein